MAGHIYGEYGLRKEDLDKMRIRPCPRCKHPTLQARITSASYEFTCLNCGGVITTEEVIK